MIAWLQALVALILHVAALAAAQPADPMRLATAAIPAAPAPTAATRAPIEPTLVAGLQMVLRDHPCNLDGWCPYRDNAPEMEPNVAGAYFPGSRLAVIIDRYVDSGAAWTWIIVPHELCHAHQQWSVEQVYGPLSVDDTTAINLVRSLWPQTQEGAAWVATGGTDETFADACAKAWRRPETLDAGTYDLLRRVIR